MQELIAKKRLDYAGKRYAIGAHFAATAEDARILTLVGLAAPVNAEPPERRRYRRRDMRAQA